MVISELVSNALEHGRGQVVLRLGLDEGIVRGEVIDQGGGFEHEIRERGPEEVSGRGLFLVEALTNRWGIHEGTTHVWFEPSLRRDVVLDRRALTFVDYAGLNMLHAADRDARAVSPPHGALGGRLRPTRLWPCRVRRAPRRPPARRLAGRPG